MKEYRHYLNGKYVTEAELLISPRDLGYMRSFGVFTVFKTYNQKSFKLKEHIDILLRSAELIGLKHSYNHNQLVEIVENAIKENHDGEDKTVKIMISGGPSNFVYQVAEPTLIVLVDLLKLKNAEIYEKGIKMNSVKFTRYIPESKTTNYIEAVRQTQIGREQDAYEPVFYSDEQVYEGSNSNIFAVKYGIIYTPKNNVYLGITRGVLIKDLKEKLGIVEKDFTFDFLLRADEAFIASSGKEVVPIVKIDENIINDGNIGPRTMSAMKEFRDFVSAN